MNFELSEEHLAVRDAARDFAINECKPGVIERDSMQTVAYDQLKQLGELGFMGMMVDPKYGGSGMDTLSYVLAIEEVSKIDASISVAMSVNNSLVCWGLEQFGNEEQKQKYLVPLAKGEKVGAFLTTNHINAKDINLVSSHGHTVFHQPEKGITLQIGDGQTTANSTQIITVNNFRTLDVKLGGQGAPLVPIGDKLLFSKFNYCLNIGGIANLTCKSENSIVAGDLTFANMASNYLAQKKNKAYDMDGELASNGCLNEALLYDLNQLTYFEKSFPKSLAFEDFSNWFLPVIENHNISIEDKLNTLGHHLFLTPQLEQK